MIEEEIEENYEFEQADFLYQNIDEESDISIIENLMKSLEEKLGLRLFKETYDIVNDNVNKIYNLFIID